MSAPDQPPDAVAFGQWLKRRRHALDLTQDQLAERVGYASATLRKIERGERRPSREMAAQLADLLGIPAEERAAFLRLARSQGAPDGLTPAAPPPHLVVHTRLQPPPLRASLVARPRLTGRLTLVAPGSVSLLVAPAGWGKTTLVQAWLAELRPAARQRVAWLALDPADDEPAALLRALVAALRRVEPACCPGATSLFDGPLPPPEVAAGMLVNDLVLLTEPLALVLDDYHLLHSPAAHQLLRVLVERLPSTVHLVITSREDPPLPLMRLRLRGQLAELRAADLRFSEEEASALLAHVLGVPLDAAAVATLTQRTEGWAAGLQIAGLALRERADPAAFVRTFGGSHRLILDFLAEEVLGRLPDHLRHFLLQTAILDQFCGPLCDAVLLGADVHAAATAYSQAPLEELERAQLFLVPLDDTRSWYRYHHLFGEVLRAQLMRGVSPPAVRELHRRAAGWYAGQELWGDAFRHAREAQEWELAATALERLDELLLLDSPARLRAMLLAIPEPQRAARPRLLLLEGFGLFHDQNIAAAAPVFARAAAQAAEQGDLRVQGEALLLLADVQRTGGAFATASATLQEALATPLMPATRVTALVSQAYEGLAAGDWRASVRALDTALALVLSGAERRAWLNLAINMHSPLLVLPGRAAWAERFATAPFPWAEPPISALRAAQHWLLGYSQLLRGELTTAAASLAQALAINAALGGADRLGLDVGLQQVFLLALRGDAPAAEQRLAGLLASLEQPALATYYQAFGALYRYAHGWLRLQQGRRDEARAITAVLESAGPGEWPTAPAARLLMGGQLALADGVFAEAESLLRAAATEQTRYADALLVGDARVPLALAVLRLGRAEEALRILRDALDDHVRRDSPGLLLLAGTAVVVPLLRLARAHQLHGPLVARLLRAVDAPAEPSVAPAGPDELTAREREVLGLLARGASNQAIADALVISLATAKTHVASILAKLGAANRTEAIARARERELL